MMNFVCVLPVIMVLVIAAIIVKIAAVALNLTGLDEKTAFFQALSAFTGTGYTTQDAELVVRHELRRKIVIFLMITGNAGLVSVITSLVLAFIFTFKEGGSTFIIGNIVAIFLAIAALAVLSNNRWVRKFINRQIKDNLSRTQTFTKRPVEEIFRLAKGYGIAEVTLGPNCLEIGKTLAGSSLRKQEILILAIERGSSIIPAPHADDRLNLNDTLICYGNLDNISRIIDESWTAS
jgi:hypothetical protein